MRVAMMTLAAVLVGCVASATAEAQLSAGGQFGYGVSLDTDPDPYRVLVGVRAGWNFDALYLGGNINFYSGEKRDDPFGGTTTSYRQLQVLGIEAGYDLDYGPVTLRPLFGFGGALGLFKVGGRKENQGAGFINFGAELLTTLRELVFVGGGLRFTSTFYDPDNINAFTFYVTAGARFDLRGAEDEPTPPPAPLE